MISAGGGAGSTQAMRLSRDIRDIVQQHHKAGGPTRVGAIRLVQWKLEPSLPLRPTGRPASRSTVLVDRHSGRALGPLRWRPDRCRCVSCKVLATCEERLLGCSEPYGLLRILGIVRTGLLGVKRPAGYCVEDPLQSRGLRRRVAPVRSHFAVSSILSQLQQLHALVLQTSCSAGLQRR
jgi:hypothetical protein